MLNDTVTLSIASVNGDSTGVSIPEVRQVLSSDIVWSLLSSTNSTQYSKVSVVTHLSHVNGQLHHCEDISPQVDRTRIITITFLEYKCVSNRWWLKDVSKSNDIETSEENFSVICTFDFSEQS